MKSRHWGTLLGMLAFASLGFSAGCGEDAADPPATGGTAGTAGSSGSAGAAGAAVVNDCDDEASCKEKYGTKPGEGAEPPAAPADAPAAGEDLVHALSKLYVGETDRGGNVSIDAWKDIGFDIDGWTSTAKQGFHCKPASGAKAADIRVDGNKGIDNSFGKHIVLGILATLIANPSNSTSLAVKKGGKTVLLDLGSIGTAANYSNAPARWLRVGGQGEAPSGDWSSFPWPPFQGSTLLLSGAYLAQNIWVSGEVEEVVLTVSFDGFSMRIPVKRPRVSIDLKDRENGRGGQLGGIVSTTELVAEMKLLAKNVSSSFCNEHFALGIIETIHQASDILLDGTQDPDKECDGISLGVGFESRATSLGSAVVEAPTPDPCAP